MGQNSLDTGTHPSLVIDEEAEKLGFTLRPLGNSFTPLARNPYKPSPQTYVFLLLVHENVFHEDVFKDPTKSSLPFSSHPPGYVWRKQDYIWQAAQRAAFTFDHDRQEQGRSIYVHIQEAARNLQPIYPDLNFFDGHVVNELWEYARLASEEFAEFVATTRDPEEETAEALKEKLKEQIKAILDNHTHDKPYDDEDFHGYIRGLMEKLGTESNDSESYDEDVTDRPQLEPIHLRQRAP